MKKHHLSIVGILFLGYFITILIGTILLLLPISKNITEKIEWYDAMFAATSATCVTGLIPFPTTNWSTFGQIVLLVLIQIGGLGFMTIISLILMMFKKNIGIYHRTVLMQSAGSYSISGVTNLIKRIILLTLFCEIVGAIILSLRFSSDMEIGKAIYFGIFHSVSAFCNAGFDLFGVSLINYQSDWIVLSTIMLLIIFGGLGFFEFTNFGNAGKFTYLPFNEKILNALFLSVSPRTAGFNSLDLNNLTSSGKLLTMVLMFIGGSTGSTAGGVKVTTIVVVIANLVSLARGKDKIVLFKRRVNNNIVKQSSALVLAYLIITIISTLVICAIEPNVMFESVLFEVISGIGTVGLSLGLSSYACVATKLILTFLMYVGRLGAFSLFDLLLKKSENIYLEKPEGKVLVG